MTEYNPDSRTSPWLTLAEWATEQAEQDTPISRYVAEALGFLTGVPMAFWLEREQKYREGRSGSE